MHTRDPRTDSQRLEGWLAEVLIGGRWLAAPHLLSCQADALELARTLAELAPERWRVRHYLEQRQAHTTSAGRSHGQPCARCRWIDELPDSLRRRLPALEPLDPDELPRAVFSALL